MFELLTKRYLTTSLVLNNQPLKFDFACISLSDLSEQSLPFVLAFICLYISQQHLHLLFVLSIFLSFIGPTVFSICLDF